MMKNKVVATAAVALIALTGMKAEAQQAAARTTYCNELIALIREHVPPLIAQGYSRNDILAIQQLEPNQIRRGAFNAMLLLAIDHPADFRLHYQRGTLLDLCLVFLSLSD
jgi:hypothetical protein